MSYPKDPKARYLSRSWTSSLSTPELMGKVFDLIVVIPAYDETDVAATIDSLASCDAVDATILVHVLYNGADMTRRRESDGLQMTKCQEINLPDWLHLVQSQYYHQEIRKWGVGHARKILMDHALDHQNSSDALIVNLDADCEVARSYFQRLLDLDQAHPEMDAFSLGFAHTDLAPAITAYELHLRYFRMMTDSAKHPHAYHTVGSAMAVRGRAYIAQGGMPLRQAGEDFYFLHKYSKVSRLWQDHVPLVFPQGRASDRVPFGTGRAVLQYAHTQVQSSYHPDSFELLEELIMYLKTGGKSILAKANQSYQKNESLDEWIHRSRNNSQTEENYQKRIFQEFDAFRLMKYLHYLREHGCPDIEVTQAVKASASRIGLQQADSDALLLLEALRPLDLKRHQ